MAKVTQKYEGESLEHLIRRFRKKVDREGLIYDLRKRMFYLSPSQKKRKKHETALRERERLARKAEKKRLAQIQAERENREKSVLSNN